MYVCMYLYVSMYIVHVCMCVLYMYVYVCMHARKRVGLCKFVSACVCIYLPMAACTNVLVTHNASPYNHVCFSKQNIKPIKLLTDE